ncbi:hypothetical protein BN174_3470001 [Clostridioides difficile E15]|nr:hypothetical protein [Clostridioides difficile]MDW0077030.1 hypothetical protein [Clostridioides difficile]CCL32145.1 hypothetical protein BN174_3470001 [Clostridioides difficile E15]
MIKHNIWLLECAEKQSYEMCMEAVSQNGLLLEDVRWSEVKRHWRIEDSL